MQSHLDDMVTSIHQLLRANGNDDGHVSCYLVSAKTGLNCLEVMEQLQLRLAYRQVFLDHTNSDSAGGLRLGSVGGEANKSGCACG